MVRATTPASAFAVAVSILWDAGNAMMDLSALASRRAELEAWLCDFEKQEPGGCTRTNLHPQLPGLAPDPFVLTERNEHLDRLENDLSASVRHPVVLRGGMGAR